MQHQLHAHTLQRLDLGRCTSRTRGRPLFTVYSCWMPARTRKLKVADRHRLRSRFVKYYAATLYLRTTPLLYDTPASSIRHLNGLNGYSMGVDDIGTRRLSILVSQTFPRPFQLHVGHFGGPPDVLFRSDSSCDGDMSTTRRGMDCGC